MKSIVSGFRKKTDIEIDIPKDGIYKLKINTETGNMVFDDEVESNNKKIILKGFSKKTYIITLIPIF